MLVEAKLLTQAQLDAAINDPQRNSLKIGEFLVSKGLVNEEDIVQLLSLQLRMELYKPEKYPIDPDVAPLVPAEIARKYRVVPLAKQPHLLVLGMHDPLDINAMDIVEDLTHLEVEPIICTSRQIDQLTGSLYGMAVGMDGILDGTDPEYGHADGVMAPGVGADEDVQVSSLLDMAEGAPVVRMVNWIIAQAVRESASDIHISPERGHVQLRFRIDGRLREVPAPPKSMLLPIISRIKILAHMDIAISRVPQDGRFTTKMDQREINIRASTIPTINGENVVLRLLDMGASTYTLDNLGMADADRERIEMLMIRPHGMILSTGPTGSGKSTSLYAILRGLNSSDVNIITVEDPVEYRVSQIRQLQLNRKAGMTFASGLRSILRQDPDVIMVGEIRDAETARIAVQAALTGHRVLSTVHTNDAVGAVTRLIDMDIEPFLVASVLMVSFAQRLLRRVCDNCAEAGEPDPQALRFLGLSEGDDGKYVRAVGCHNCMHTGYQGRIGVFEVLTMDGNIKEMISRQASSPEIIAYARKEGGMRLLKEDAADKVRAGITTLEEAMSTVAV
jgi:type IV pilus assembly protein PilB